LPFTGSPAVPMALLGSALVAGGAALAIRRRRAV
jgi:LPXTG-motif cell wall-anchored protein